MSEPLRPVAPELRPGRGAASRDSGRYERFAREDVHDGWDIPEALPPLRTEVAEERPRSVITRNASPDLPFDRTLNPYRGCEHGCIYCFARPSHAYLGLSPGLDFETRLVARPDAPDVLARELSKAGYSPAPLAIGSNTDPYQPIEKNREIMRRTLRVLSDFNHPVAIVTKGMLIERDIDILAPMAERGLVSVGLSVTTLDPVVSRAMEPRVPAPDRRLKTINRLAQAGIPVRVMIAPVIPALTDHELENIVAAGADAGASTASYIVLRLPREVAPLFEEWALQRFPGRAERILNRVRQIHGGTIYDASWGKRMTGEGPWADLLAQRFRAACKRHGLNTTRTVLRSDLFQRPPMAGDQLSLF